MKRSADPTVLCKVGKASVKRSADPKVLCKVVGKTVLPEVHADTHEAD